MTRVALTLACGLLATIAIAGDEASGVGGPTGPHAQAGYLADWADRSTWKRPNKETGQTEIGLGLVLDGGRGPMRLALFVSEPSSTRPLAVRSVGYRVAAGARVNPAVLRTPTLKFTAVVDARGDTPRQVEVDASSTMAVDNPAPGAAITSGTGTLPRGSIQTLADAAQLSAEILGVPVRFRDEQIVAVRAFRDRVAPKGSRYP